MSAAAETTSSQTSGPALLRDVWAFAGVSTLLVVLRVVAKLRIRKFGWDDILMAFALCLGLAGSAVLTIGVNRGYGRPVEVVSDPATVILYDYIAQTLGISGGVAGRVAFIIFILGILGTIKGHRLVLWVLASGQVVINMLFILIIFLQCPGHASAIWSHSDDSQKCWDLRVQTYYGYFEGSFNSATDLYLAAFSTYVFWNLNLKLHVKIGLMVLLGLGIFAMVASIIKTVQLNILANANNNPTKVTVNLERWLYIETYLVIITASIPCIRSLFRSLFRSRRHNSSYGTTRNTLTRNRPYSKTSSSSHVPPRARASIMSGRTGVGRRNFNEIDSEDEIILQEASVKMKTDSHMQLRDEEEFRIPV